MKLCQLQVFVFEVVLCLLVKLWLCGFCKEGMAKAAWRHFSYSLHVNLEVHCVTLCLARQLKHKLSCFTTANLSLWSVTLLHTPALWLPCRRYIPPVQVPSSVNHHDRLTLICTCVEGIGRWWKGVAIAEFTTVLISHFKNLDFL